MWYGTCGTGAGLDEMTIGDESMREMVNGLAGVQIWMSSTSSESRSITGT